MSGDLLTTRYCAQRYVCAACAFELPAAMLADTSTLRGLRACKCTHTCRKGVMQFVQRQLMSWHRDDHLLPNLLWAINDLLRYQYMGSQLKLRETEPVCIIGNAQHTAARWGKVGYIRYSLYRGHMRVSITFRGRRACLRDAEPQALLHICRFKCGPQ